MSIKPGYLIDRMTSVGIDNGIKTPARRRHDELTDFEVGFGVKDLADYVISTHEFAFLPKIDIVVVRGVVLPYQGTLGRIVGEINGL